MAGYKADGFVQQDVTPQLLKNCARVIHTILCYLHGSQAIQKQLMQRKYCITKLMNRIVNHRITIIMHWQQKVYLLTELYTMNIRICFVPSLSWTEMTIFGLSECCRLFSSTPSTEDCNESLTSNLEDSSTSFNNCFADSANEASSCFFNLHA